MADTQAAVERGAFGSPTFFVGGEIYFDDGVHVNGPSLRQSITCSVMPQGVSLSFGARAGKYRQWWKQIAVTVHGAQPVTMTIADHPRAGSVMIAAK